MEHLTKYPLDLSASSRTNVAVDLIDVPQLRNRAFALHHGAFYAKGLTVKLKRTGRILEVGKDYRLDGPVDELYTKTRNAAYWFIHFTKEDVYGEVEVQRQVVGAQYERLVPAIHQMLSEINLDNRSIEFMNIVGFPTTLPPMEHLHHVNELFGFKDYIDVMKEYIAQVASRNGLFLDEFTERFNSINGKYDELLELINKLTSDGGDLGDTLELFKKTLESEIKKTNEALRVHIENFNSHANKYNEDLLALKQEQQSQNETLSAHAQAISETDRSLTETKTQLANFTKSVEKSLTDITSALETINSKLESLNNLINAPHIWVNKAMTVVKPVGAQNISLFITTSSAVTIPSPSEFNDFCSIDVSFRLGLRPKLRTKNSGEHFSTPNDVAEAGVTLDRDLHWDEPYRFKLIKVSNVAWEVVL